MPEGQISSRRRRQRAQSLVEFAISSTVLLLLAMGLIDLSRAFYYSVALQGAAREGARHGAWFNTAARANLYLDDADVMTATKQALYGAGFTDSQITFVSGTCLSPTDGNANNDKPYAAAMFPTTPQTVNVYICYTQPGNPPGNPGPQFGTLAAHPNDNSWRLGDINVAILMNFRLITPFIQGLFGNGIDLAYNEHFTIQGKP
ncbi:MAG TPA: TadE/TadG family type IV pilus assembly protein [Candidatus Dormibacteraeota bacterium]|nr:TadE/TadG family type IV pilus assembly protein [Candidatus Dormibacteraeota bacterium]